MSKVEDVARAIHNVEYRSQHMADNDWEVQRDLRMDQARAAIAAVRDIDKQMFAAHKAYCDSRYKFGNSPTIEGSWQAMLDSALKE